MLTSAASIVLYLLVGVGVAALGRGLDRPLDRRYLAAFWVIPVAFLFPCFFAPRTPLPVDHAMLVSPWSTLAPRTRYNANLNDAALQMAPWAKAVRIAWKEGSLPLRDPWNGCGTALAANGQSGAFSPFTLLAMPLPIARGFTVAVAAKLFLALCGTWLWLGELGVSRGSAAFGAVSFALSCTMTPWLLFPHSSVFCLWPWALLAIELVARGVRRSFSLLVAVFFLWPLCGHPESLALAALFTGLWLSVRVFSRDLPRPAAVARQVASAAAIAVALSAFLLLPQIFAISASNRLRVAAAFREHLLFGAAPHGPRWPNGFFTAFFPRSLGDAVASPMVAGGMGSFSEMSLAYFGIVGWSVALLILRPGSSRRRSEVTLLLPLLLGFGVAVGIWPIFELFLRLPVLGLMLPLRYFAWVSLAGSAIAAFELDRLRADLATHRGSRVALPVALAALGVFAVAAFSRFAPLHGASGALPFQRRVLAATVAVLAVASIAAVFASRRRGPRAALALLLAGVGGAELFVQGRRLYRFGPASELFPPAPLLTFLRERPGAFRVLGEGTTLFPNSNVFAGVQDIRTHDPVERRDYVDFLNATCGYDPFAYFKTIRDVNAPALDLLNVKYLIAGPGRAPPAGKWKLVYSGRDGTVFENTSVLPRVFPASQLVSREPARDQDDIWDYREQTNAASFRVRGPTERGDLVLVASLVQDGGWSATDESGRALPTGRVMGPFLSLLVPRGEHRVRLRYTPPGFLVGAVTSLAAAIALFAVAAANRRSQLPRASPRGVSDAPHWRR